MAAARFDNGGDVRLRPPWPQSPQRAAVLHIEGPLLVLAGAGSGKTRVIVEKIAHLIQTGRYPAKRIAAITFTNKSAREMRERVAKRIRGDAAQELTISTFHALGLRILQIEHTKLGLRRGFSIFDADDSAAQLKDLLPPGSKPDVIDAAKQLISRAKNAGLSPEQAAEAARSTREREAAALYALPAAPVRVQRGGLRRSDPACRCNCWNPMPRPWPAGANASATCW